MEMQGGVTKGVQIAVFSYVFMLSQYLVFVIFSHGGFGRPGYGNISNCECFCWIVSEGFCDRLVFMYARLVLFVRAQECVRLCVILWGT